MSFDSKTVRLTQHGGLEFEILADDTIIGPAIERGSWADEETTLMLAHVEPGATVVDLGANVGWFAAQAVLAGAHVEAFEPVPAIADIARRNVERAMAVSKGTGVVHTVAGGKERGTAQIALASGNHGDNRVVGGDDAPEDMSAAEMLTIEIAPVDEFVKGPARFLKVDTQGSEWLALQGAKNLLANSPDLALLIELWPYALRETTAKELLDYLTREGFTLGKATNAPFPMSAERILAQLEMRDDPVKAGIDLYGTRGRRPFHVLGIGARMRGMARSMKEP